MTAGKLVVGDEFVLEQAGRDDREAVIGLQQAAYAANRAALGCEPLPLTVDYDEIFATQECWVLRDDGNVIGVLFLDVRPDDLLIWSVATAPARQSTGAGNVLMAAAEVRARELGRGVIRLYTGQRLTQRIAWYSRLGYLVERVEEMDDRVAIHMMKKIA